MLLSRFGRGEVPLKRLRCLMCHPLFRPTAGCLAEVKEHNVTPEGRELAALLGSSWPYETAASVLKRLWGVDLSDERRRQITHEQGKAVADEQRERAEQVVKEAVNRQQIRAQ